MIPTVPDRQYHADQRTSNKRAQAPRGLIYDPVTGYLSWVAPAGVVPFTHYNLRHGKDDGPPLMVLPQGTTTAQILTKGLIKLTAWNDISRVEGEPAYLEIGEGWAGANPGGGGEPDKWWPVTLLDYIPPQYHDAIRDGTIAIDLTGWVQEAIDDVAADNGGKLWAPWGTYPIKDITLRGFVEIAGDGMGKTIFKRFANLPSGRGMFNIDGSFSGLRNLALNGMVITPMKLAYSSLSDPMAANLTDNTSIWMKGGATDTGFHEVRIFHTGGRAIIADARTGHISRTKVKTCLFENNRPHLFGPTVAEANYGSWTGGIHYQGDGYNFAVHDLHVDDCTFRRSTGNQVHGHLYEFSRLHTEIKVTNSSFVDIGRDGVLIGGTSGGVVSGNTFRRIGYICLDDTGVGTALWNADRWIPGSRRGNHPDDFSPGTPAWISNQWAVGLDTAGLVRGVNYADNSFLNCLGAAMDGDGYAEGTVSGNTARVSRSDEPEYTEDQVATWPKDLERLEGTYCYGFQLGNTSLIAQAARGVKVVGNYFFNLGLGALRMYCARKCNVSDNHIVSADVPLFPPIALGNVGATNNGRSYDNTVHDNTIYYNPPTPGAAIFEDAQYGAFQSTDKNWVSQNRIIGNLAYEFKKAPSTASVTGVMFSSMKEGLTSKSTNFLQREDGYLRMYAGTDAVFTLTDTHAISDIGAGVVGGPIFNVSRNAVGGAISTGARTTLGIDDVIATGVFFSDQFLALTTEDPFNDTRANLFDANTGLIRYDKTNKLFQVSVAGGAGAGPRIWTSLSGGGGPGGPDQSVQWNDGGVFGGDAGFSFNRVSKLVNVTNAISTGPRTALGLTDVMATGILWGGTFLALTNTEFSDPKADALDTTVGLLRYDANVQKFQISTSKVSGARVWSDLVGGTGNVPGGPDQSVQWNNNGSFGGDGDLSFNRVSKLLHARVAISTGVRTAIGLTDVIATGILYGDKFLAVTNATYDDPSADALPATTGLIRYDANFRKFMTSSAGGAGTPRVWVDLLTSANAFVQGGNDFGTAAILGTNGMQALYFETDNANRWQITAAGMFLPALNNAYDIGTPGSIVRGVYAMSGEFTQPGGTGASDFVATRKLVLRDQTGSFPAWDFLANATATTSSLTIRDNAGASVITFIRQIAGAAADYADVFVHLEPDTHNGQNLGKDAKHWSRIYVTDIYTSGGSVYGHLDPSAADTYTLGSESRYWRESWVKKSAAHALYLKTFSTAVTGLNPSAGWGGLAHKTGTTYWVWDGAAWVTVTFSSGGGAPGGNDRSVQFNNAGVLGGDPDFLFSAARKLSLTGTMEIIGGSNSTVLMVRGASGQTLALTEWRTNTGTGPLAAVDASGNMFAQAHIARYMTALTSNQTEASLTAKTLRFAQKAGGSDQADAGAIDYGTMVPDSLTITGAGAWPTPGRRICLFDNVAIGGTAGYKSLHVTSGWVESASGYLTPVASYQAFKSADAGGIAVGGIYVRSGHFEKYIHIAGEFGVPAGTSGGGEAVNGWVYYDKTANKFRGFEGGVWKDFIGGAAAGVSSINGTPNQITATPSTGVVTLTLPQNIHTAARPTFAGAGLLGRTTVDTITGDPNWDTYGVLQVRGHWKSAFAGFNQQVVASFFGSANTHHAILFGSGVSLNSGGNRALYWEHGSSGFGIWRFFTGGVESVPVLDFSVGPSGKVYVNCDWGTDDGTGSRLLIVGVASASVGFNVPTANANDDAIQVKGGGVWAKKVTADMALYMKSTAASSSLNNPTGYGGFAHKAGTEYWIWNGSAWVTINLATVGGGVTSITAKANQTTVNQATGAVTIGTVQDIAITSRPQFNGAHLMSLVNIEDGSGAYNNDFRGMLQVRGHRGQAYSGWNVQAVASLCTTNANGAFLLSSGLGSASQFTRGLYWSHNASDFGIWRFQLQADAPPMLDFTIDATGRSLFGFYFSEANPTNAKVQVNGHIDSSQGYYSAGASYQTIQAPGGGVFTRSGHFTEYVHLAGRAGIPSPTTGAGGAAQNGWMYYDTNANKFKGLEAGTWKDMISTGGGVPAAGARAIQYNSGLGTFAGLDDVLVAEIQHGIQIGSFMHADSKLSVLGYSYFGNYHCLGVFRYGSSVTVALQTCVENKTISDYLAAPYSNHQSNIIAMQPIIGSVVIGNTGTLYNYRFSVNTSAYFWNDGSLGTGTCGFVVRQSNGLTTNTQEWMGYYGDVRSSIDNGGGFNGPTLNILNGAVNSQVYVGNAGPRISLGNGNTHSSSSMRLNLVLATDVSQYGLAAGHAWLFLEQVSGAINIGVHPYQTMRIQTGNVLITGNTPGTAALTVSAGFVDSGGGYLSRDRMTFLPVAAPGPAPAGQAFLFFDGAQLYCRVPGGDYVAISAPATGGGGAVSSVSGGTGVTVSPTTGATVVSIGQNVATNANTTFGTVTTNGVVQANVTGSTLGFKTVNNTFNVNGAGQVSTSGSINSNTGFNVNNNPIIFLNFSSVEITANRLACYGNPAAASVYTDGGMSATGFNPHAADGTQFYGLEEEDIEIPGGMLVRGVARTRFKVRGGIVVGTE